MIQAEAFQRDEETDRKNAGKRMSGRFRNCSRKEKGVSEAEEGGRRGR